jgi:hypothetical protein
VLVSSSRTRREVESWLTVRSGQDGSVQAVALRRTRPTHEAVGRLSAGFQTVGR